MLPVLLIALGILKTRWDIETDREWLIGSLYQLGACHFPVTVRMAGLEVSKAQYCLRF